MNRLAIAMVLALLGGCVAEEPGYDDVSSQASAIEAPPPDMTPLPGETEADMHSRWILGECTRSCFNQGQLCGVLHCHNGSPGACPDSCQASESDCLATCLCTWGDHPEGVCYDR